MLLYLLLKYYTSINVFVKNIQNKDPCNISKKKLEKTKSGSSSRLNIEILRSFCSENKGKLCDSYTDLCDLVGG